MNAAIKNIIIVAGAAAILCGCVSGGPVRRSDDTAAHLPRLSCLVRMEKNHKRSLCYNFFYTGKGRMFVDKRPLLSFEREGGGGGLQSSRPYRSMIIWPDCETAQLARTELVELLAIPDERALGAPRTGGSAPVDLTINVDLDETDSAQFDQGGEIIGVALVWYFELFIENGAQQWRSGAVEVKADCKRHDMAHG